MTDPLEPDDTVEEAEEGDDVEELVAPLDIEDEDDGEAYDEAKDLTPDMSADDGVPTDA